MKQLNLTIWIGLCFFMLGSTVWSGEAQVSAFLDKNTGTLEDFFTLTIQVQNVKGKAPVLPEVDGIQIRSRGSSQQFQYINGESSRVKEYTYEIEPLRQGRITIPSIKIQTKQGVLQTDPLSIMIAEKAVQSSGQGQEDIYVTSSLDPPSLYWGQTGIYTLRLFSRVPISNAKLNKPEFAGFAVEPMGDQKTFDRILEGRRFQVVEMKFALTPLRSGQLEVNPATIEFESYRDDPQDPYSRLGFFSRGQRYRGKVSSSTLQVAVLPLPEQGKPKNFSGLVGQYQLESSLSKSAVPLGESVTLTLSISGLGDVRKIPKLPWAEKSQDAEFFKVYEDQPEEKIQLSSQGIQGSKTIRKALVPQKEGKLTVPSVALSFFDPIQNEYKTLYSSEFDLEVLPGSLGTLEASEFSSQAMDKKKVSSKAADLFSMYTKDQVTKPVRIQRRHWVLWAFLFVIPWAMPVWVYVYRKRFHLDPSVRMELRRKKALKKANQKLKQRNRGQSASMQDEMANLQSILKEYFADRFGKDAKSLTSGDIMHLLEENNLPKECVFSIERIVNSFDAVQYGNLRGDDQTLAEWKRSLPDVLKKVDRASS